VDTRSIRATAPAAEKVSASRALPGTAVGRWLAAPELGQAQAGLSHTDVTRPVDDAIKPVLAYQARRSGWPHRTHRPTTLCKLADC
jgi:hypothetical protein